MTNSPRLSSAVLSSSFLSFGLVLGLLLTPAVEAQDWPSFRGPGARGLADGQDLPRSFNLETGENVLFQIELPGIGHSSPVIAGNRLFLTTAVAEGEATIPDPTADTMPEDEEIDHQWLVLCLNKRNGSELWRRTVSSGFPRNGRHPKASRANPTPATDGKTVVAVLDSQGLFAFDAATGEQRWQVDLGVLDPGLYQDPTSHWSHASSPLIHDGLVFAQVDRHSGSYLAAFAIESGEQVWRVERDEMPVWATPTLHLGERAELIVIGGNYVRGYRPQDGKELWRFHDFAEVKTPTPFVAGERVIIAGGYRGRPLYALRVGAEGDLSVPEGTDKSENLLWRTEPGGPYTSTPIAYRGRLYFVRDTGILTVVDLESGEFIEQRRLDETFSASPIAGDGHLYFAGEGGTLMIFEADAETTLVESIDLGEALMATPAASDGVLYVRGRSTLWAIGKG